MTAASSTRITRIPVPTPFRVGPVNVYLLEGAILTLVDTGPRWPKSLEALEASLAARGHELASVERVILTHQHFDHVGLAETIRRRSGASVVAIEPLARYLDAYPASAAQEDEYAEAVMRRYSTPDDRIEAVREISKSFWRFAERVEVDTVVREGDLVAAGDRELRVVLRPGHSPTDTLFVDEADGMALVGDHVLPSISSNPVVHRPLVGEADASNRDPTLVRYLDSLQRTDELDLREVLPGHGDPLGSPHELIRKRIGEHQERKELIYRLIVERPQTAYELGDQLWGVVERSQVYLAISEILGHTDLLLAEGRVREVRAATGDLVFEASS
jgi:glyoxylase-like metal-dependent hydrolase (beta-lactamase superfamily II)